jgi:hypothetical protein
LAHVCGVRCVCVRVRCVSCDTAARATFFVLLHVPLNLHLYFFVWFLPEFLNLAAFVMLLRSWFSLYPPVCVSCIVCVWGVSCVCRVCVSCVVCVCVWCVVCSLFLCSFSFLS